MNNATVTLENQGRVAAPKRTPGEFNFRHMPGAINIPLPGICDAIKTLDRDAEYITVCRTGRRAAAAAFILAQRGLNVMVISSA